MFEWAKAIGICLTVLSLVYCSGGQGDLPSKPWIGSWMLQEWTAMRADGALIEPFGERPQGLLLYTEAREVVLVLMRSDRQGFSSDDPSERSPQEIEDAFHSFFTYSGRYQVDTEGGVITHQVELCSNPNWVGRNQTRYFHLDGGSLILTTPPIETITTEDQAVQHKLVWARSPLEVQ